MATITAAALKISSPSFQHEEFIPAEYTCEGKDRNPPITIQSIPEGTKSLALIIDDPDAPNGTFDHWLIWNIEPAGRIDENSAPGTQGRNSTGKNGYKGPCPPSGTHHYHFKMYALDLELDLKSGADKTMLEQAMKDHILASGELIGLYAKRK